MKCWPVIAQAVRQDGICALVTVASVKGSAPRETGTRMIIAQHGIHGTIGGGTLEWQAIAQAQRKMTSRHTQATAKSYSLGPDLGQCCGGQVTLVTEVFDQSKLAEIEKLALQEAQGPFTVAGRCRLIPEPEAFGEQRTTLYLLGAGHVGRALILPLATLPFNVIWLDPRADAFPEVVPENITIRTQSDSLHELQSAPENSLALVMSHSHALDLAFTDASLRNDHITHVGLIGSATKRARFVSRLRASGVTETQLNKLTCPIGMPGIESKEPTSIAISTAAQLLIWREQQASASVNPVQDHRQQSHQ